MILFCVRPLPLNTSKTDNRKRLHVGWLLAAGLWFLIFAFPSHAKILFQSNFEGGQTYLAKALKPGARKIHLAHCDKLEDWPLTNGTGVVGFDLPDSAEMFTYESRKGTVLKGVSGISRTHPQWAGIRTPSRGEWLLPMGYWRNLSPGNISLSSTAAMEGAYSVIFDCDSSGLVVLRQELPSLKASRLYCRFQAEFSKEILQQETYAVPFWSLNVGKRYLAAIAPVQSQKARSTLAFLLPHSMGAPLQPAESQGAKIIAGKPSCIEAEFTWGTADSVAARLWIDGNLASSMTCHHALGDDSSVVVAIGKTRTGPGIKGTICVDDIVVAGQRLGPIPLRPTVYYRNDSLHSTSGPYGDPTLAHIASQWQISSSNSWLLPVFNSGHETLHLAHFPHPRYVWISGTLSRSNIYEYPYPVPTGVSTGKRYWARVRQCPASGNWSEWSRPIQFVPSDSADDPGEATPEINAAWFSEPGSDRESKTLEKTKWYDLHIRFKPTKIPETIQNSFIDVSLTGDPENFLGNYRNRGTPFRRRNSYHFSLSMDHGCAYVRQDEGSMFPTGLCGRKGLSYDGSADLYYQDFARGEARIRCRLLTEAVSGPWKLSVFFKEEGRGLSPVFEKLYLVQDAVSSPSRNHRTKWIALALALAVIALAWSRKHRQRNSRTSGDEQKAPAPPVYSEHIRKAIEHIEKEFRHPLSPKDVAQAIGVSPNWLSKLFKREVGQNIMDHIVALRIEEAKRLLRETKEDVSEVAFQSGFNSLTNFHRTFKTMVKESPLSYRKTATT